jgi:tetratricopeptide (TPR) repeat protein
VTPEGPIRLKLVSNVLMRRGWLALVFLCLGCASAPIRKSDLPALAEADRRVLAGCYDCLLEARATYSRIGVGRARSPLITRLFEVQILIVLREIELALDWRPAVEQARALAAELPRASRTAANDATTPIDGDRVLALVDLVPLDDYGSPVAARLAHRRDRTERLRRLPDELAWLDSAPLAPAARTYLRMALDCGYPPGPGQPRRRADWKPDLPPDAPPLLLYRRAICGVLTVDALTAVRDRTPGFVETAGFVGRLAVAEIESTGDVLTAMEESRAFYARFPESSAATYLYATFHQAVGDCPSALRAYDETVALQPAHERALVARTVCLSDLNRHDDAIAAASRVIALQTVEARDGYYWRAWNLWMLTRLSDARADIERAKGLRATMQIATLAGAIEHDQDDLGPAERDLTAALAMPGGGRNCEAAWYLGLVYGKRQSWHPSAQWFDAATGCYLTRQAEGEAAREALEGRVVTDAEFKARQLTRLETRIRESAEQRSAAAYNAARAFILAGNLDRAGQLIEVAALDKSMATPVDQLRRFLGSR